jgi:hypothetical protein
MVEFHELPTNTVSRAEKDLKTQLTRRTVNGVEEKETDMLLRIKLVSFAARFSASHVLTSLLRISVRCPLQFHPGGGIYERLAKWTLTAKRNTATARQSVSHVSLLVY